MPNLISYASAFAAFEADIKPLIIKQYGSDDIVALREGWNDYTDMLTKDGQFNALMYHHCPAVDDDMADDSDMADFLLTEMAVTFTCEGLAARTDGTEWNKTASHWRVTIHRANRPSFTCEYSMGSAHTSAPELKDVLENLFSDAEAADYDTFEAWADAYGMDSDSRKAEATYHACRKNAEGIAVLFNASDREDLAQVMGDLY